MACPPLTPEGLDPTIEALLLGSPMSRGRRLLGLEYERLILHRDSRAQAPVEFAVELLAGLAQDLHGTLHADGDVASKMTAGDFAMSLEPGGQLEVATAPRTTLGEIDKIVERATAAIERRLDGTPYALSDLGHSPVTPVAEIGLLRRSRYLVMDAAMPARGPLTRNMMRATAGFQLAFDVHDRADAGRKLALLYRLSPVLTALTANSREAEGRDTGHASYRHLVWWETDVERSGIPPGCLHTETAVDGYVRYARRAKALFKLVEGRIVAAPDLPFEEWVAREPVTLAELDLHLSSLFPFIRLRNYVEVRCFDTVPWPLVRSVLAMLSGVLYCGNATRRAEELSSCLVFEDPAALRDLHLEAARLGIDARVPGGPEFREIVHELIGFAGARLGESDCTWASAGDLAAVEERLTGKAGPRPA